MITGKDFSQFLKQRRRLLGLTQRELADKSGVGLRFVRDVEQGKQSVRLDKLNQLLGAVGAVAGPVELAKEQAAGHETPRGNK